MVQLIVPRSLFAAGAQMDVFFLSIRVFIVLRRLRPCAYTENIERNSALGIRCDDSKGKSIAGGFRLFQVYQVDLSTQQLQIHPRLRTPELDRY